MGKWKFLLTIALAFSVEAGAVTYNVHEGWNLLGAPCNIPASTFNKDGIITVWKWTDCRWEVYSPDEKIKGLIEAYGLPIFDEVKALEGFWVNAKDRFSINLPFCSVTENTFPNCQNLLVNGDFENGTDGWKIVNFTSGASVTLMEENGNHFVRMHHNNDGDWCSLSQEIASKLEKGKTYVFSYRYRTKDKVDIGIRFTETSTIMHSTALNEDYGWNHPLVADGKWHTDSFEFTVTDNHPRPDEPLFGIFFDYHNTGDVDIDDVIIAEKDSCQVSPPGENGTIDLNRGLVAYWSFDNCDARDDSGNGHDGEIKGNLECVVGVKGKAFKFDGKSSIITPLRLNGIPENQNITKVVWGKTEKFEEERDYPFITNFNIGDSSKSVYIGSDRIGITTGFSGYYGDGYCYEYVPIIINGEEVNWGDC